MATEPFDKRYDAWAAAEAEVYKAMDREITPEKFQALRERADLLLSELWGDHEQPLSTRADRAIGP
jgi:hypothetical protein